MRFTTRNITKSATTSLAAAAVALSLTACGGGDDTNAIEESAPSETTSEVASETPTPEESPSEPTTPSEEGASGDLTKPGSELSIGDSAIVPGSYAKKNFVIELTVTEIKKGTSADLKKLKIEGADPDDLTPFYVKVSSKVVSGEAGGFDPSNDLDGFAGEQPAQSLIEFGEFKPCNGEAYDLEAKPGEPLDSCTTQIVEKGSTVDTVVFAASDTAYNRIDGEPITWK